MSTITVPLSKLQQPTPAPRAKGAARGAPATIEVPLSELQQPHAAQPDLDALAAKFGGTVGPAASASPTPNLDALAAKFGGTVTDAAPSYLGSQDLGRLLAPTVGGIVTAAKEAPGLVAHPIASVEQVGPAVKTLGKLYWNSVRKQAAEASAAWSHRQYLSSLGHFMLGVGNAAGGQALKAVIVDPLTHAATETETGHVRAGIEDFIGSAAADALAVTGGEEADATKAAEKASGEAENAVRAGEQAAAGEAAAEPVSGFEKAVKVGDKAVHVPVTAATANPGSLAAKGAHFLGASVFGKPVQMVRLAQNALAQRMFEGLIAPDLIDAGTDFRRPLSLAKDQAQRHFDHAAQLYAVTDGDVGNIEITVPRDALPNLIAPSPQDRVERLDSYLGGELLHRDLMQGMTVKQAVAARQQAAKFARRASSDQDWFMARQRVNALDLAIQRGLAGNGMADAAVAYTHANALWHDGGSLDRVADSLINAMGRPTETGERPVWNLGKLEYELNDPNPAVQADWARALNGAENVTGFRNLIHTINTDGGVASNKLATGVGSLFLGNYPVYRAVWTLGGFGLTTHAALSIGSLWEGYRLLADLAVQPGGAVAAERALKTLQAGQSALRDGARLAWAGVIARAGHKQTNSDVIASRSFADAVPGAAGMPAAGLTQSQPTRPTMALPPVSLSPWLARSPLARP